jgi:hypothetical protein
LTTTFLYCRSNQLGAEAGQILASSLLKITTLTSLDIR